jgi:hypothetical protein
MTLAGRRRSVIPRRRRRSFGERQVGLRNTNLFNKGDDAVSLRMCGMERSLIGSRIRGSLGFSASKPCAAGSQFGGRGFVLQA